MYASVRAERFWEFPFELGPTSWKIGVSVAVGYVRNVLGLTKVNRVWVVLTIGRGITQRLHTKLCTLLDHNVIVIAAGLICPHTLKFVKACVGTTLAAQLPLKWRIHSVSWGFRTQYLWIASD
jgi:hypothetical protein